MGCSKRVRNVALISVVVLGLSVVSPMVTTNVSANVTQEIKEETYYFSNKQIFEYFENSGIDVKGIIGEGEYAEAIMQDMLSRGGTYIKGNKNGFTVYLNSTVCSLLIVGGIGGVAYLTPLLATVGIVGLHATAVIGGIQGAIGMAGSTAWSRGMWIRVGGKNVMSWGYQ